MNERKQLLLLADGSERIIQTAEYMRQFLPDPAGTRVVIFHVFTGMPPELQEMQCAPECPDAAEMFKKRADKAQSIIRANLEKAKAILVEGGMPPSDVEIRLQRRENGVARDIIAEARKGYTAVVLRRRGLGTFKNLILGSVAVKLLQSLDFTSILLVGKINPAKNILLAVDSSPASMKAVQAVAEHLGGRGYSACLFHAIPGLGAVEFHMPEDEDMSDLVLPESCVEAFRNKVVKPFKEMKRILIASGFAPDKVTEKIVSGVLNRAEAIIAEAESGDYGSVVVGRRGLSKVEAFFMGRVSHAVVYGGKDLSVWVV